MWSAMCDNPKCFAYTEAFKTKKEVVECWNNRPAEEAKTARIAELESAIRRCCRNCWANDATDAAQCRLCGLKEALEGVGK